MSPHGSAHLPPLRRGFAVVDVETTGLDPTRHRIIEVAVALVSPDGEIERRWSSLLKPRGGTGPVHIHGITRAHVRDAPQFSDVADELVSMLNGRILVAHNAQFDWGFLAAEAARAGIELPVHERLCTVTFARQLNIPARNFKLSTLAQHLEIPVAGIHRADADVSTLIGVLARCLTEAERLTTPLPLEPCTSTPPALVNRRSWLVRRLKAVRLTHKNEKSIFNKKTPWL